MTSFYSLVLEAALRALIAATVVWAGLRILRVANVMVQKAAWALVLVAALALPLAPHIPGLPAWTALRLPVMPALSTLQQAVTPVNSATAQATTMVAVQPFPAPASTSSSRYPAPAISDSHFGAAANDGVAEISSNVLSETAYQQPVRSRVEKVTPVAATSPTAKTDDTGNFPIRVAAICLLAYLGVATALVLRLLLGLATALRLWMTAKPVSVVTDASLMEQIPVRSSARVASPVNIGSGILLPIEHSQWDEEKLRIVLAHERSHIRQGDFYLQLIAGVYASLFWFSPLGWWLKRKLYELGEAISDRAGLEEAASRASYAQLLLEFAAMPRPTLTGVAMARTSHLSQRIERLLNESSFRQAFAASGRRTIFAAILVPAALLTATALVRVQAAPLAQDQPATLTGQSTPEQVTAPAPPPPPAAVPAHPPAIAPDAIPVPPPPPDADDAPPAAHMMMHVDPEEIVITPHVRVHPTIPHVRVDSQFAAIAPMPPLPPETIRFKPHDFAFAYGFGQDGDSYALVGEDGKLRHRNGWIIHNESGEGHADLEKARKMAHGAFLWFQRDGKSYIVDDPSVVSQIEAMDKPMDDLQSQMRDMSKQMRAFADQQREKARQMRDISIQTPDLSKELATLKAAEASLQAKQGGTISQKDIADLQREIGKIQGQLGSLQGKLGMEQGGFGKMMGEFGEQQGKLGSQMGKLGSEMGRIAQENHSKIKSIIDESISNGKAKQVK
jgi:beta-lactamase regulating signal transducer with metallopeptidase domain